MNDFALDLGVVLRVIGMAAILVLLISVRLVDFYYPPRSRWVRWVWRAQEAFIALVGAGLLVNIFSTLPPTPGLWVLVFLGTPASLIAALAATKVVQNRH